LKAWGSTLLFSKRAEPKQSKEERTRKRHSTKRSKSSGEKKKKARRKGGDNEEEGRRLHRMLLDDFSDFGSDEVGEFRYDGVHVSVFHVLHDVI